MRENFTLISFSRVRKLEFPDLFNGIVSIVDGYDLKAMHISEPFQLLLEAKPQLSSLIVINNKLPETETLNALRNSRKALLNSLVRQTKAMLTAGLDSQSADLKLVHPFVMTYWSSLFDFNNKTIAERLKQMLLALEVDTTMQAAFSALGLMVLIDELKTVEAAMVVNIESRRKSSLLIPKMRTREVIRTLGATINDLLTAISLAIKLYPEVDYTQMTNEINVLLNSYQTEIKSRNTRRKNANTAIVELPLKLATAV